MWRKTPGRVRAEARMARRTVRATTQQRTKIAHPVRRTDPGDEVIACGPSAFSLM
jgi:hypothetical protein